MPLSTIVLEPTEPREPTKCQRCKRKVLQEKYIDGLYIGHFYYFHVKRYCIRSRESEVSYEVPEESFPLIGRYEELRAHGS